MRKVLPRTLFTFPSGQNEGPQCQDRRNPDSDINAVQLVAWFIARKVQSDTERQAEGSCQQNTYLQNQFRLHLWTLIQKKQKGRVVRIISSNQPFGFTVRKNRMRLMSREPTRVDMARMHSRARAMRETREQEAGWQTASRTRVRQLMRLMRVD